MPASIKNKEKGSSVRTKINEAFTDLATAQADITAIESDIATIEGNITTIQGQITTINSDITTIEGDITTIEGNITTINGQITSLGNNKQDKDSTSTLVFAVEIKPNDTPLSISTSDGKNKYFQVKTTTGVATATVQNGFTGGESFMIWNDSTSSHKYTLAAAGGITINYAGSLTSDINPGVLCRLLIVDATTVLRIQ
jgi:prophage DNA circulation protein